MRFTPCFFPVRFVFPPLNLYLKTNCIDCVMLWAQKGGASMKLNLIHAEQNEVEVTIQGDTGSEEVQRLLALLHEDAGQGKNRRRGGY